MSRRKIALIGGGAISLHEIFRSVKVLGQYRHLYRLYQAGKFGPHFEVLRRVGEIGTILRAKLGYGLLQRRLTRFV